MRLPRPQVLLGLAVGLCAITACQPPDVNAADGDKDAETDRPPLVRTTGVEVRTVRAEIETTGYLESEHRVVVLSKVPGRVQEILADEGQQVRAGEVLARLDAREAAAAVKGVELQLEDRRVRSSLANLEIDAAKRRVEQAKIERNRTDAEFERLAAQPPGDVARKALDEARFARDSAIEALAVSEYAQKKAELDKQAAVNAIAELEARLEEAESRLADHEILAPLDGTIVTRKVRGGETISSATELFDVADLRDLITYLSRPQIQLPIVRNAKTMSFTVDSYVDREFTADIDLVSPVIDPDTGHFKMRARVRADDVEDLRPGMFLRAKILTEERRDALMVPKGAVLVEGGQSVVFAVRDGVAHRIAMEPGLEEPTHLECQNRGDGGLRPEDQVVVAGHSDLEDQTIVEVTER